MKLNFLLLLASILFFSCQQKQEKNKITNAVYVRDPHSYAQPEQAVVKHLSWNAEIDFTKKQIAATANWQIENTSKSTKIVFDTRDLIIQKITLDDDTAAAKYTWLASQYVFMARV